jgi:hypothetical protein
MLEQFVPWVLSCPPTQKGKALARWTAGNKLDLAAHLLQLTSLRSHKLRDFMWFFLKPARPGKARFPHVVFTLLNQIVLQGLEGIATLFNREKPVPPGLHQAKRETATSREKIDESKRKGAHELTSVIRACKSISVPGILTSKLADTLANHVLFPW